ncbi:MAG: hypothetical protein J6W09_04615 [Bacteroidales bacterium]|nr:hypothetical protein [Bacteroidales bacterium]
MNDVIQTHMTDRLAVELTQSALWRVYDTYNPTVYIRRYTLLDPSHYRFYPINMGVEIESPIMGNPAYAPGGKPGSSGWNPGYISHIIESGDGYPWAQGTVAVSDYSAYEDKTVYAKPRPYLTDGLKDYVNDGRAASDLADGLRAKGYIVE